MHELYTLKDKIVKELGEYGRKELSSNSIEMVDKLAHAAKNIAKVIECCEEEEYSNAMSRAARSYRQSGRSYADGGSYTANYDGREAFVRPDGSYSRRRDDMGRYSRSGKDMTKELNELMNDAPDERTREEIRKLIEKMDRM